LRIGKRLAIDVGTKRIGLATSDPQGILATPLATVGSLAEVQEFLTDDLLEIYIGLPINLQGKTTASTALAIEFGLELAALTKVPIRYIDERLTTALVNQQLRQIGKSQKQARGSVDQMSAVLILESALEQERRFNAAPGVSIEELEGEHD
jgi:putative Holliday junction resolvase